MSNTLKKQNTELFKDTKKLPINKVKFAKYSH